MALPLFWLALISQLIIVIGYFWFYRKEQLCKPFPGPDNIRALKYIFFSARP